MLIEFFPEKVDILQLENYVLLFLENLEKVDIFAIFKRCGYFPRKTRNYFFRKKNLTHQIQKSFDVATKRKLVTRRFKSQMRSYLKYNYQIINFNKPFAHGLRSCKNVPYHVNQISKNRKWIIFNFWVRFGNPLYFCSNH